MQGRDWIGREGLEERLQSGMKKFWDRYGDVDCRNNFMGEYKNQNY